MPELKIKNLHVSVEGKHVLKGINITVRSGEMHALMGPNGSGKTTLCCALMGHPRYRIEKGSITLDGKEILKMSTDKRAKAGLFLAFQNPAEVEGVQLSNFIWSSYNTLHNVKAPILEFHEKVLQTFGFLGMGHEFASRSINQGFSGGEKKRSEIAQMLLLKPKIAVLDEPDSGLDVDSLKAVASGINRIRQEKTGLLVITHYQRILNYVKPDFVHVIKNGVIARSGDASLAKEIEKAGYGREEKEEVERL